MKRNSPFVLLAGLLINSQMFLYSLPALGLSPKETILNYQIGEQGANHRNWQKVIRTTDTQGNAIYQTNLAYVELASGLNYKDSTTGKWLPSKEEIDSYAGGAIAQYGQHKVIFANNLNTVGAIDLQTPDGKELRSHVLGLSYYDSASGKSILIAQIKDCQGQIVGSNQVIYAGAFVGINADVRYTYRRGSFEQDIILQAQPPMPESFGFNSASTVLQVLTEFDFAPAPNVTAITNRTPSNSALSDELLNFGAIRMIRGRAFLIGDSAQTSQSQSAATGRASVSKQWTVVNGRNLLIESVPLSAISNQLARLPGFSLNQFNPTNGLALYTVSTQRLLPASKLAKSNEGEMKLASIISHGLVLDYVAIDTGTYEGDFSFQSDTTYYVSGQFDIDGTTTIEGGTVIKYAEDGDYEYGGIYPLFGFNCQTTPYLPATITSADDNSVGETISGSSGNPSRYNCSALDFDVSPTFTGPLEYLHIRYAAVGLTYGDIPSPSPVRDCQFINAGDGIQSFDSGAVTVENCLFSGVSGNVLGADDYPWAVVFNAANLTVHDANDLITVNTTLSVTNSLFICVTNWGHSFTGAFNATNSSDAGIFESADLGNEYLAADSPYRNIGTTNIDPDLLADLQQTTTYTPADGGYPDTDTPDLGYHYPIIGSIGTDFWMAFFDTDDYEDNLSLYISSQSGATGIVAIPGFGITTNFTVAAGAVTNMSIPLDAMMLDISVIETYGIHITTDRPVSVYALKYYPADSAASTCYPTTLLGTNYCLISRPSFVNIDGFVGYSELGIVATTDNTTVTITPSANADLVGFLTASTNIVLQQGQTYQIQSSDEMGDVTGTRIASDKPIAVFAGADEAYVPDSDTTTGASNPLMQEQLPVDSWGTNVVSMSFAGRTNGDLYRVLAYTNTTVTITNSFGISIVTNLTAGTFCETNLDGWVWFQANQPIQVAQFDNGGDLQTSEGDPCEILLPPTGHYLNSYTITTGPPYLLPGSPGYNGDGSDPVGFNENYLNLIVPQAGTNSTYVDGIVVTNFAAISKSGYYRAQVSVTTGCHTVTSSQPMGVESYGFGYLDAYSYFGGIVK